MRLCTLSSISTAPIIALVGSTAGRTEQTGTAALLGATVTIQQEERKRSSESGRSVGERRGGAEERRGVGTRRIVSRSSLIRSTSTTAAARTGCTHSRPSLRLHARQSRAGPRGSGRESRDGTGRRDALGGGGEEVTGGVHRQERRHRATAGRGVLRVSRRSATMGRSVRRRDCFHVTTTSSICSRSSCSEIGRLCVEQLGHIREAVVRQIVRVRSKERTILTPRDLLRVGRRGR